MRLKFQSFVFVWLIFLLVRLDAQNVSIEQTGANYTFSYGNMSMNVDTEHGAKISSIKQNNIEYLLTPNDSNYIIWGSTLWPAPQKDWGWPPPLLLDNGYYKSKLRSNTLICESESENGMQFLKKYRFNKNDTSISTEYFLCNVGEKEYRKALWEVSRVPTTGMVIWPKGEGGVWGKLSSSIEYIEGYCWLDLSKISGEKKKLFADGSKGWFAHINNKGVLMLRTFDDVTQNNFAKGEGEIEIYVDGSLTELENLSAENVINKGESTHYATKWYFRHLSNNNFELGSKELIKTINDILSKKNP